MNDFPSLSTAHMKQALLCLLLGLILLPACAMGPDYRPPSPGLPAQWSTPSSAGQAGLTDQDLSRWWQTFHDPLLTSLEERALAGNLDLKLATARIQQARALRRGAGSSLAPSLTARGQYQHSRSPASESDSTLGNQFQLGFDASWESDLFGGRIREVEAAEADLLAASEDRHGVMVSLTAEVARAYLELRGQQQAILIAAQAQKAAEETADITRQLFTAGLASRLEVANAEAQAASRAARLAPLEGDAQQRMHGLALLLGREPAALTMELSPLQSLPSLPPPVPTGVPADLLRRRPDIRQAEAHIHAATARIGVAMADLFPKLTLSGLLSLQTGALDSWLQWSNRLWSLGPSASWQLFDGGRAQAEVMGRQSLHEQSLLHYQQTVLRALREVEDALVTARKEAEHHATLRQSKAASQTALDLAATLHTAGQSDFLSVLQAQQTAYATEEALLQSDTTQAVNLVALYKALGGGWQVTKPTDPPPAGP